MKLKLLLLLTPMCFFAQERVTTTSGKTVILNTDYTWKYEDQQSSGLKPEYFKTSNSNVTAGLFDKVKIPIKNGEDQIVNVFFEFTSTTEEFNRISSKKLDKMIDYSREYVMLYLKNKYSFIPRKVSISHSDSKNAWVIIWEYTAKNSYGGETEGTKVLLYDDEINRIDL